MNACVFLYVNMNVWWRESAECEVFFVFFFFKFLYALVTYEAANSSSWALHSINASAAVFHIFTLSRMRILHMMSQENITLA